MAFPPVLLMSRRLRYLLCVCKHTRQKPCLAKYVVGNPGINNFNFPQSSGKRSLHLIQKLNHPMNTVQLYPQ